MQTQAIPHQTIVEMPEPTYSPEAKQTWKEWAGEKIEWIKNHPKESAALAVLGTVSAVGTGVTIATALKSACIGSNGSKPSEPSEPLETCETANIVSGNSVNDLFCGKVTEIKEFINATATESTLSMFQSSRGTTIELKGFIESKENCYSSYNGFVSCVSDYLLASFKKDLAEPTSLGANTIKYKLDEVLDRGFLYNDSPYTKKAFGTGVFVNKLRSDVTDSIRKHIDSNTFKNYSKVDLAEVKKDLTTRKTNLDKLVPKVDSYIVQDIFEKQLGKIKSFVNGVHTGTAYFAHAHRLAYDEITLKDFFKTKGDSCYKSYAGLVDCMGDYLVSALQKDFMELTNVQTGRITSLLFEMLDIGMKNPEASSAFSEGIFRDQLKVDVSEHLRKHLEDNPEIFKSKPGVNYEEVKTFVESKKQSYIDAMKPTAQPIKECLPMAIPMVSGIFTGLSLLSFSGLVYKVSTSSLDQSQASEPVPEEIPLTDITSEPSDTADTAEAQPETPLEQPEPSEATPPPVSTSKLVILPNGATFTPEQQEAIDKHEAFSFMPVEGESFGEFKDRLETTTMELMVLERRANGDNKETVKRSIEIFYQLRERLNAVTQKFQFGDFTLEQAYKTSEVLFPTNVLSSEEIESLANKYCYDPVNQYSHANADQSMLRAFWSSAYELGEEKAKDVIGYFMDKKA